MIAFEIAGLPMYMVAVCTLLALIGSSVQGSLGFGLGMLTSPIFAMIDHSFVPVAMMLAVMPLTFGVAFRDRKFIDASGFKWAILGRFPGVFIGIVALRAMNKDTLAYSVATSVTIAVIISIITTKRGQVVPTNATTLTSAGFASFIRRSESPRARGRAPTKREQQRRRSRTRRRRRGERQREGC